MKIFIIWFHYFIAVEIINFSHMKIFIIWFHYFIAVEILNFLIWRHLFIWFHYFIAVEILNFLIWRYLFIWFHYFIAVEILNFSHMKIFIYVIPLFYWIGNISSVFTFSRPISPPINIRPIAPLFLNGLFCLCPNCCPVY